MTLLLAPDSFPQPSDGDWLVSTVLIDLYTIAEYTIAGDSLPTPRKSLGLLGKKIQVCTSAYPVYKAYKARGVGY